MTSLWGLSVCNTAAKALAAAIKDEQFDLIFTGLQSDDYGYAQTGHSRAELLDGRTQPSSCRSRRPTSGSAKRELEAGYFQFVDMPTPAVLTIQSGINKLRYATLTAPAGEEQAAAKVTLAEVQSALGDNLQKIGVVYSTENEEDGAH
jgi:electron transfer flavoprotein beta subunit